MGNTQCMPLGQLLDQQQVDRPQSTPGKVSQPGTAGRPRTRATYKRGTAFVSAAASGQLAVMTKLAAALTARRGGSDALATAVNKASWSGHTPLMLAAKKGHADCVAFLLQCGECVSDWGEHVLAGLGFVCCWALASLRMRAPRPRHSMPPRRRGPTAPSRAGADPFAHEASQCRTALHFAAREGHAACIAAVMAYMTRYEEPQTCSR
jgi:Ankyrin repeats (3 copies)